MPRLSRVESVVVLLLIAGLTRAVAGQGEKLERPREANVESVSGDIDPSLRSRIVEKLQDQIDAAQHKLTAERDRLEQLREQLRAQEANVRQLDLKVQYLQDRLTQWSPVKPPNQGHQANHQGDTSAPVKP